MILVVIASDSDFKHEIEAISELFENGLTHFHLRKPQKSKQELEDFLNLLPKKHLNKVILHTHFELVPKYQLKGIHINKKQSIPIDRHFYNGSWSLSAHSIPELINADNSLDYLFLSPIYNSLSKKTYPSLFPDKMELKKRISEFHRLKKPSVLALGGIDHENIINSKALGFDGVACIGAIWQNAENTATETIISRFKRLKNLCL